MKSPTDKPQDLGIYLFQVGSRLAAASRHTYTRTVIIQYVQGKSTKKKIQHHGKPDDHPPSSRDSSSTAPRVQYCLCVSISSLLQSQGKRRTNFNHSVGSARALLVWLTRPILCRFPRIPRLVTVVQTTSSQQYIRIRTCEPRTDSAAGAPQPCQKPSMCLSTGGNEGVQRDNNYSRWQ